MSTEKKLQDYLHLYYGCQIMIKPQDEDKRVAQFVGFTNLDRLSIVARFRAGPDGHINCLFIKPILRPLSDITEEEKEEFIELCGLEPEDISCLIRSRDEFFPEPETSFGTAHLTNIAQWAIGVKYLLSKHFDLFQLIDLGLAIDSSTLSTPKQ